MRPSLCHRVGGLCNICLFLKKENGNLFAVADEAESLLSLY